MSDIFQFDKCPNRSIFAKLACPSNGYFVPAKHLLFDLLKQSSTSLSNRPPYMSKSNERTSSHPNPIFVVQVVLSHNPDEGTL